MKTLLRSLIAIVVLGSCGAPEWGLRAQERGLTPERLRELLQRYPAADTDRDGVLTESEAFAYLVELRRRESTGPVTPGVIIPEPTWANVSYGPHARNVLDFWPAKSAAPAPVVVYIHGGGFVSGDKANIRRDRVIAEFVASGVAFAAINYRFLSADTPLQDILRDGARAIQFIRSKASEWNIDKTRVAAYGGSAGAGTSMWIAFHDDLADPASSDPVLRESTRLVCVGSNQPQFSYDFLKWTDLFGEDAIQKFGGRYRAPENYGFKTVEELRGPAGLKVRAGCDMMALMSKDDPPLYLSSTLPDLALENTNQFLHHPKHAQQLLERAREVGLTVVANIPALKITPAVGGAANWRDFACAHLGVKPADPDRLPRRQPKL